MPSKMKMCYTSQQREDSAFTVSCNCNNEMGTVLLQMGGGIAVREWQTATNLLKPSLCRVCWCSVIKAKLKLAYTKQLYIVCVLMFRQLIGGRGRHQTELPYACRIVQLDVVGRVTSILRGLRTFKLSFSSNRQSLAQGPFTVELIL